ncbi:MAG TPA: peptidylprolyl isomerase [Gemmatimonadaceae bacterium]|nr:peptidylprolyl isomerase [Gemmatimonadaceae bacterium]
MQLRRSVGLWLLLLIPAGAGAQRAADVATRDVDLYARIIAMTDTRTLDMPLVESALGRQWRPLRAAATLAIGQVGAEVGMPGALRLRSLLGDSDRKVAANAAYSLGLLRDSTAVADLSATLDWDREVAREAAWALGEIGAPAKDAIVDGLRRRRAADVALHLLLAAAKLRPVPVADVEPYLRHEHPSVMWAAAYAIARTRAPAGLRHLLDLEQSEALKARPRTVRRIPDVTVIYADTMNARQRTRAEIARALTAAATGDSLGNRAFGVLSALAGDVDPHVRVNAIRSIATFGARAKPAVMTAARDFDPNVRIAAAQSFTTVPLSEAEFAALWAADTSVVFRSGLLASATRAGSRPLVLREWAGSSDWRLRAAVAAAAGDSLDRRFAVSRALPFVRDPDPRVRQAAYAALAPASSVALEDSVHAVLVQGLSDRDFYVRATVTGVLADRPSTADLPAVLAAYSRAARDSANDARLAAVQYVSALWKKDSATLDAGSRQRLAALPVPADPLERFLGKTIAPLAAWGRVAATPRALAWYRNLVRTLVLPALSGTRLHATIHTVRGPLRLEMHGADAPITVNNFLSLARSGYYRNTRFHRVVPNFVAQDGDPRDDGNGGPGYSIRDEMNRQRYERGAVGMALAGPDTGGSQYFLTHSPQPHLDGHYTIFARLIDGYEALDRIVQGDLILRVETR